ncbi:hypothetical protein CVT25_010791 [Psilocybe cyanescens]|uniref:FAD-binding PCMH-type domain-containing protein n=1 Tax=Psilocybe cyanescens TaxID=93625 RepID=A0A409WFA8_PSICY|nr:hypothetical protein CVT25_010791 [Psilocybe cyanescens]
MLSPLLYSVYSLFTLQASDFSGTSLINTSPDWNALNHSVHGHLKAATPFSQPCFSQYSTPNQAACTEIQSHNEDHLFRSSHFGAYELTNWETCQTTGDQCLLDWLAPTNPAAFAPPRRCLLGNVPSYYIDVSGPDDVKVAYDFAKRPESALLSKILGSGPGTLALWTHNLNKLVLNRSFIPDGCDPSDPVMTAITIGAGQQFRAIYDFARDNKVTFVGGADPSVGASGGWVMGGGHSALSPTMGLGVDRVLEFKIVTPDGKYRTANRCQNQDLFFALRGGGGGTFGVVLESTFIASPRVTVQAVFGEYENTRENSFKLLKALAGNAVQLATDGWGGYITPPAGNAVWANAVLDSDEAQKSGSSVVDAFASINGTVTFMTFDSYSDFYDTFIDPHPDPVGRPQILGTRLIPSDKFGDDILVDAIANGMLDSDFGQILAVTPFPFKDFRHGETSINPAWRNAVWEASAFQLFFNYFWNYNSTLSERVGQYKKLTEKLAVIRERTPDAGVYFNEADVYEPDYIKAFWGDNYDKLLSIKQKYDPDHILDCWRCVGWKGPKDPLYKCYPKIN